MAASRALVRWVVVVTLLSLVVSSCTELRGERFGLTASDDGTVVFVACMESLPAIVGLWRVGSNNVVGDGDDEAVWGPAGNWVVEEGQFAYLETSAGWEEGLYASVAADTNPVQRLVSPPASDEVLDFDGSIVSEESFSDGCTK